MFALGTLVRCSTLSVCGDAHGGIEDAPAPKALHSFKAHVSEGKIYVTANPTSTLKANLARQPKLLASGTESTGKGVVIIGGGSGSFNAIESLREVSEHI